jgi:hypothetical protein
MIPKAWKVAGSISGQAAAVAVNSVAKIISAAVRWGIRRPFRQHCHAIHDQEQTTTATASFVIQPWA